MIERGSQANEGGVWTRAWFPGVTNQQRIAAARFNACASIVFLVLDWRPFAPAAEGFHTKLGAYRRLRYPAGLVMAVPMLRIPVYSKQSAD